MSDFNPGDVVRLRLSDRELECTILESSETDSVLVKLSSGYNIGIPKEHIHGHEIVKTRTSVKRAAKLPSSDLPGVGLIITGGTIASRLDPATGGVAPVQDATDVGRLYPALLEQVSLKRIETPFLKLSENMVSEDWISLATVVKTMLDDSSIRGIIITHGTDTLHYTAAALSFFLPHLTKPVVLTYAQRSIDRASSDAELNLRCSARFALSECAEVVIVGHADLNDDHCIAMRGTKVRKMHSSRRDAFKPINTEPLANVWPDRVVFSSSFNARQDGSTELDAVFNDKVALVTFYPGQSPDIIDYYRMHGYKGIIIVAPGLGNVPAGDVAHSWVPAIKKALREGVIVCAAAQTLYGRLNPYVYATGRELEKTGMIFLEDMLAETAFVKLGWVLAHRSWKEHAREKMLLPFSHEISSFQGLTHG